MTTKRYTPHELRFHAERFAGFTGIAPDITAMLRQAAEDYGRLQEAVDLLAKCPKATDDMYVGIDSVGYGKQVRAFVKAHKARTQEQAK